MRNREPAAMDRQKNETLTPLGKYVTAAALAAGVAAVWFGGSLRSEDPPPREPERDTCEGLSDLQCFQARDLERRRREHVEALQEADMMP